jgi:hypothetical protein
MKMRSRLKLVVKSSPVNAESQGAYCMGDPSSNFSPQGPGTLHAI